MRYKLLFFLIFLIPLTYADDQTYISCGGDDQMTIGCMGDDETFFMGQLTFGPGPPIRPAGGTIGCIGETQVCEFDSECCLRLKCIEGKCQTPKRETVSKIIYNYRLVIILGVILFLSVLLFLKVKKIRNISSYFYLAAIIVSILFALDVGKTRKWIGFIFLGIDQKVQAYFSGSYVFFLGLIIITVLSALILMRKEKNEELEKEEEKKEEQADEI